MLRFPRVALIAGVASVLFLAACGTDKSADGEADTSSFAAVGAVAMTALNGDTKVDKEAFINDLLAAIDRYESVHLSIKAATMGLGEADVRYGPGGTEVHVDAEIATRGPIEFVIADGAIYIEQQQGRYLKIDESDSTYGPKLRKFSDIGVGSSVAGLGKGIRSLVRIENRDIDGVEFAGYRAKIDPSKAEGAFKALAGSSGLSDSMTFDIFIDGNSVLRLIEVKNKEMSTVAFTNWGEPVSITVPSADQVLTP